MKFKRKHEEECYIQYPDDVKKSVSIWRKLENWKQLMQKSIITGVYILMRGFVPDGWA